MDLSLNNIINIANEIHLQNTNPMNFIQNKQSILELRNIIDILKTVYNKISNIEQICSNKYLLRCYNNMYNLNDDKFINTSDIKNPPNMHIKSDEKKPSDMHIKSDEKKPLDMHIKSDEKKIVNLVDNISTDVYCIDDIKNIPDTQLYWISNINQFAFRLNGVIFRGVIGDIYNKAIIQQHNTHSQVSICKYGNLCQNIQYGKICKYYHDPLTLLKLLNEKKIEQATFDIYKNLSRNYVNTSWIYNDTQNNKKNIFMRHFGSKTTLRNEIELVNNNMLKYDKMNIVDTYKNQTMHDILIILALNKFNLIND